MIRINVYVKEFGLCKLARIWVFIKKKQLLIRHPTQARDDVRL